MAWQYQINEKIMTAVTFVGIFIKLYHTNLFFFSQTRHFIYVWWDFFQFGEQVWNIKKLSLMLEILTHSTFIVPYISSALIYFPSFIIEAFRPSLCKKHLSFNLCPMSSFGYARYLSLGSQMSRMSRFSFFRFLLHWNNYHK